MLRNVTCYVILRKITVILRKITVILRKITVILRKITVILRKISVILRKITWCRTATNAWVTFGWDLHGGERGDDDRPQHGRVGLFYLIIHAGTQSYDKLSSW